MRLPAEQRRIQLLEVARDMFAERGFHATSMDDLAAAAGVTKPVLYQHFKSKRALYIELLELVGAQLLGELNRATGSVKSGRERVEQGFAAYFRWVASHPPGFRLLFGALIRNDSEFAIVVEQTLAAAVEAVVPLIDIDVPAEQRAILANAIVGLAEATSRRALSDGGEVDNAEQLAAWLAELAWFGLRGVRVAPVSLSGQPE
jgi:AcrR family transcriptional regulator